MSESGDRCCVDGCVIPYHDVVSCGTTGCGAHMCMAHANECIECEQLMCPDHGHQPVCPRCANTYMLQHETDYTHTVMEVGTKADCAVPGCQIPEYEVEQCTGCTADVCGGHARDCKVCERGHFCPACVATYSCRSCVKALEYSRSTMYDYNAGIVLGTIDRKTGRTVKDTAVSEPRAKKRKPNTRR